MKPKAIVLDIDDVCLNFCHVLMQLRRGLFGVSENVDQLKEWKLSAEQAETFQSYESWIYARMQPKRGVKKALRLARKKGYYIILMTARSDEFRTETVASLRYHGIISDEVLFNKNKSLKINRLQEKFDIKVFVDDKPYTVNKVSTETNVPNIYIMDMPSNREVEFDSKVKRIKSLTEMEI